MKIMEIRDINPSPTRKAAMEEQAAAERQRRATITRAGGEKTAAVLEAEGRLEASKLDAEAKVVLAGASQQAIEKVTVAIGNNEMPMMYLIGEKYVESLKKTGTSENAKIVMLLAEIPSAIRGIFTGQKR